MLIRFWHDESVDIPCNSEGRNRHEFRLKLESHLTLAPRANHRPSGDPRPSPGVASPE